jgi:CO/xanthine dehydrogenase FAD-binding subunit
VAGGTDLVVGHRQGKSPLPARLVAIDRVPELAGIENADGGGLRIGATTTHDDLMSNPDVVGRYTALADAAALIGSPATRNVATLGGNLMNASPAMDTGAPLMVLGTTVELRSISGIRSVDLADLWTGPGTTTATADELLVACHLAPRPERSGSAYVRLEYRRSMEIAVVGAAASVTLGAEGELSSLDLALTAVGPTILTVDGTDRLGGRPIDDQLLHDVAELARSTASPISDLRAGDRYRRHCVGIMARRAVETAAERAAGREVAIPVNRSSGVGAARNSGGTR